MSGLSSSELSANHNSTAQLQDIVKRNRGSQGVGTYAVCSAHPWVLDAALQQALADTTILHVESTSSQVNQEGGYTGQTPRAFAEALHARARAAGFPTERILLGGDHLGPFPWRSKTSGEALGKAAELVRDCVLAGYTKIHLDTSMPCADDAPVVVEETVAARASVLCEAAESAYREMPSGTARPVYVVGTEVPAPGGETLAGEPPAVTTVGHIHQTLKTFESAFAARGLESAWERVIGLVVQPGVEFGSDVVFDYERSKTRAMKAALPEKPLLVYEAHSTDYQSAESLGQLVEDHFAILKVGPGLTFAFREAIFALTAIEREIVGASKEAQLSRVREELDKAMLRNPVYWCSYYSADAGEQELKLLRAFSYSDRCRYYWPEPAVEQEVDKLMSNLNRQAISMTLISQYLPMEYDAIRAGRLRPLAQPMVDHHIRTVLRIYAQACGVCTVVG
ncbi:MAG TPA: class II D-tagatose-bisphosphate aldolase, non-catalytic subunit [Terriglobales bacterium]|jgi:D-tagatose-1,6-bisphosphate aldolase subunit GatZ/KbaZ|nr:class II D-tagatose-bisphosphate aldolase, non-catalytic subunit [Terriglobales bacterium]